MRHVQIILFDGFDPLDVLGPYEVLTCTRLFVNDPFQVELVSLEGARHVPSGLDGPGLRASAALDVTRADVVIVPGAVGAMRGEEEPTIPMLLIAAMESGLGEALARAMAREELLLATVCGGALIPAFAGLLEGRHATTHHMGMEALAALGAHAVDARIVEDGRMVTAGSVLSGVDLGLYLTERAFGPRVAHAIERFIAHERRGVVWRVEGETPLALLDDEEVA